MHPRTPFKPLLSLLILCIFCTPLLVLSGEKSMATSGTDTLKTSTDKAKSKNSTTDKATKQAKSKQKARYPKRGMSMKQVRKHYGKPKSTRKSKGKVKKLWPRITVWNYGQYSVYFERHIVLHTVIH